MAAPEAPLYYQGVARTSAAFRLLKQMGWEEGEGLGKEKQGITEHVRVSKKKDNSGVGVDAQQKAASNWTFNTSAFDDILKNLKVIAADTNATDNKQDDATMEVKEQERKLPLKKVTRPQGRYKNREFGKILEGKSQVDLDAILGYRVKPKEVWTGVSIYNGSNAEVKHESSIKFETPKLVEEKPTVVVQEATVKSTLLEWWGTKHGFVRAGELGQLITPITRSEKDTTNNTSTSKVMEDEQMNCRASFCEQDQENLYKLVQDKATKGRQGLGIADRPKKIGGAHWKGQKVVLDNDDDDDDNDDEENVDIPEGCTEGSDLKSSADECKRKAASVGHDVDIPERKTKKSKQEDKPNWKKLCKQILKEVPGQTMSIKRLFKQVLGNCDIFPSRDDSVRSGQLVVFKEKINKSSKFVAEGKKVTLANAKDF